MIHLTSTAIKIEGSIKNLYDYTVQTKDESGLKKNLY